MAVILGDDWDALFGTGRKFADIGRISAFSDVEESEKPSKDSFEGLDDDDESNNTDSEVEEGLDEDSPWLGLHGNGFGVVSPIESGSEVVIERIFVSAKFEGPVETFVNVFDASRFVSERDEVAEFL